MIFFKRQLEERSNGRIKVELFFGGVLGNERELMDFVQTGVLQGTRGGFFADANPNSYCLPCHSLSMTGIRRNDWFKANSRGK